MKISNLGYVILTNAVFTVAGSIRRRKQNSQYDALIRMARVNHRALMRFVELSDPAIAEQVKAEFGTEIQDILDIL